MNELAKEKTMTVKEVAEIFKVSQDTILRKVKEYFPEIVRNGKITYLNEYQVTKIKIELEKNYSINLRNGEELPKTKLEEELLIMQAMQIQKNRIDILQKENEIMKPKALSYDVFMSSDGLHSIGEVAKMFGTGSKRLFKMLRENNYLMANNIPYQQFIDAGYFEIKQKVIPTGEAIPVTKVTAKGIVFIEKIIENIDK